MADASKADLTSLQIRALITTFVAAAFLVGALVQMAGTIGDSLEGRHTSGTVVSCSGEDTRAGAVCLIKYPAPEGTTQARLDADGPFVPQPGSDVPVWVTGETASLGGWRGWLSATVFLLVALVTSLIALSQLRAYWPYRNRRAQNPPGHLT